jgi:glycosyltransferase involved in cell wall biosynthesis
MRIVLDLQGAQCGSSLRGACRYYSLALAQAIARAGVQHEVWLALNGRIPESIEPLHAAFANLIPQERIRLFELPGPVAERDFANSWRKQAAELLREKFFADLHPDIVHVSTLFEGFANEAVALCRQTRSDRADRRNPVRFGCHTAFSELLHRPTEEAVLPQSHTISEACQTAVREASMSRFPCNAAVLRDSMGVIVHSDHAIALARAWYGDRASVLMRQLPFLPFAPEAAKRRAARKRLGLPLHSFVVSSFGWLTPLKLNDRLLEAWLGSTLAQDETCFLLFVGENHGGDYGKRLLNAIAASGSAPRIRITGYSEQSQYRDYLAAADLAVQLRAGSRGETSATVFDCLSRKVPLIVNAHGSAAELPDETLIKLPDPFTNEALSDALLRLRTNAELRESLGARGAAYLNRIHHPERIAGLYRPSGIAKSFLKEEPEIGKPQTRAPRGELHFTGRQIQSRKLLLFGSRLAGFSEDPCPGREPTSTGTPSR